MRKIYILTTLLVIVLLSSCKKTEDFDLSLIPGRWNSGTLYYVFSNGGLGHTWDAADDVTEEEAQSLTWEASGQKIEIIYLGEMGEMIPKSYTIRALTSTTFTMADDYGNVTKLVKAE